MREHLDPELDAPCDDPSAERDVGERPERDLDDCDARHRDGLVELAARDVGQADPPHEARALELGERADAGRPRHAGIGGVQEVGVDGIPAQRGEARLAVLPQRPRAPVGLPASVRPAHSALRHDVYPARAVLPERPREEPLVVAEVGIVEGVRARRVEARHARVQRGGDHPSAAFLVAIVVGRQPHATEREALGRAGRREGRGERSHRLSS